jgi:hypothetical protein
MHTGRVGGTCKLLCYLMLADYNDRDSEHVPLATSCLGLCTVLNMHAGAHEGGEGLVACQHPVR